MPLAVCVHLRVHCPGQTPRRMIRHTSATGASGSRFKVSRYIHASTTRLRLHNTFETPIGASGMTFGDFLRRAAGIADPRDAAVWLVRIPLDAGSSAVALRKAQCTMNVFRPSHERLLARRMVIHKPGGRSCPRNKASLPCPLFCAERSVSRGPRCRSQDPCIPGRWPREDSPTAS